MTVRYCIYMCLQHIFNLIENENQKEHIRHCTLHYFYRGKSAAETNRIICEIYDKHIVSENLGSKDFEMKISMTNFCGRFQKIKDEELELYSSKMQPNRLWN